MSLHEPCTTSARRLHNPCTTRIKSTGRAAPNFSGDDGRTAVVQIVQMYIESCTTARRRWQVARARPVDRYTARAMIGPSGVSRQRSRRYRLRVAAGQRLLAGDRLSPLPRCSALR